MKKLRIALYILFLCYMGVTIYMGLNVDLMISRFGLLSFFFQDFLVYGNIFFVIILIIENSYIWFLKRQAKNAEDEGKDLVIRVNNLKRQVEEYAKKEN